MGIQLWSSIAILSQGHAKQLQMRNKHRIGTWNIRSMLQLRKVQLLGEEMMRLGVDIRRLSEVRWDGQGHFKTLDGHSIVYSGRPTQRMSGVAVWIHRKMLERLSGMNQSATESLLCDSMRNHETLL